MTRSAFRLLITGLLGLSPFLASAEITDFAYSTLDTRSEAKFRIGFWQDPDIVLLQFTHESFREKLRLLGRRFEEAMKDKLIASGFGDVKISIIDDYDSLIDERILGRFDLLHCDPAAYVLPKNEDWEPYIPILEEIPREGETSNRSLIWVRKDSPHQTPHDLINRRIALVSPSSLFGGALQRARLLNSSDRPLRDGREYRTIPTGSVSEGVLRLITGLGTEEPVEAAFLPAESLGYQAAAQMLGLRRPEDLPIRPLPDGSAENLPGPPLLMNRFLLQSHPELHDALVEFFEEQRLPWTWRRTSDQQYRPLAETLSRLPPVENDSP